MAVDSGEDGKTKRGEGMCLLGCWLVGCCADAWWRVREIRFHSLS
ncbi:unnamed protein product, partial [Vitis vinifera]